ncbi:hypothetical protein ACFL2T_03640, partial [Elusimicrobiota bacterium]
YLRPLMLWQKYQLVSKPAGWDDRYFYVEHRFFVGKKLHALLIVKVRFIGSGAVRLSPFDALGFEDHFGLDDMILNTAINKWNDSARAHWKVSKSRESGIVEEALRGL